jgi:KUP system potassium uptake protein
VSTEQRAPAGEPLRRDPPPDRGHTPGARVLGLSIAARGVVFGDIGTNPLFAMRETFEGRGHQLAVVEDNVLGLLSLMFWSLVLVICVKYLAFVMRPTTAVRAASWH